MQKKIKNSGFSRTKELFATEITNGFEFAEVLDLLEDENEIEVIVKFNGDIERVAAELDAEAEIIYLNYAIITIDKTRIGLLNTYSEVEHIELPKNLYFNGPSNLISTCVTSVQRTDGFNLSGRGVIVAIIDSGIDYMHPDFQNNDGTSRILFIWDQTLQGTPPFGFYGGVEYNNQQINNAIESANPRQIVPSVDTNGHGTAVAGIAAGNGRASDGVNRGVATEADIIAVKVGYRGYESFARSTELMRALKYVIDKARRFNKPVCINMSFGMNNGSHQGDSLFETFITAISTNWKSAIVIPTGNESSAGHHYQGRISSNEVQEIEFFVGPGLETSYLSIWKNFADNFSVEMIFPDGSSTGVVGVESQTKTIRRPGFTTNIFYGQPSHYSTAQEIFFVSNVTGEPFFPGIVKLRIIAQQIVDGNYNIWLPTLEEVTEQTFFANPSIYNTMTIPATAAKVVRVAGYNDRVGNIAVFSGRGSVDDINHIPDIAAPAVNILSTRSGGGYDTFTGTSVAAPFVTGAAALMMQWGIIQNNDPFLYGERLRAFLRLGAQRRPDIVYPNASFGYGTLCLYDTMQYLVEYRLGGDYFWLQI
ncbi:PII-type proteinase precursor [Anaerotignum neopropionicum]|uniref:PII-type proteinase n=1 Tax=Anaerotignum neopropionicum TaxID=36847 RepID=A0A136WF82_9FIRM|nr:S8 family peptidase [Anaerotignum neopropionicum]KXL53208.1 PII-type proteinase precursor [Anaerotignum neopropionicum]